MTLALTLVIMLVTGETLHYQVPAAQCPRIATQVIQRREVTTAWCADPASLRPVFTTVSM